MSEIKVLFNFNGINDATFQLRNKINKIKWISAFCQKNTYEKRVSNAKNTINRDSNIPYLLTN